MVVTFAPLHNDKFLWYKTLERCCNRDTSNTTETHFADFSDSSLITSPVCCQVTLVGCIIIYLFIFICLQDQYYKFCFLLCYPSFVFYSTVYVWGTNFLFFFSVYVTYLIDSLSFYAQNKILTQLVNIGCIWKLCFGHSVICVCPHFYWTTYKTKWRR